MQIQLQIHEGELRVRLQSTAPWQSWRFPGRVPPERIHSLLVASGRFSGNELARDPRSADARTVQLLHGNLVDLERLLRETLEYFELDGRATSELTSIRRQLHLAFGAVGWQLTDAQVALIDFTFREQLADEARCLDDIWGRDHLQLNANRACLRAMTEICPEQANHLRQAHYHSPQSHSPQSRSPQSHFADSADSDNFRSDGTTSNNSDRQLVLPFAVVGNPVSTNPEPDRATFANSNLGDANFDDTNSDNSKSRQSLGRQKLIQALQPKTPSTENRNEAAS